MGEPQSANRQAKTQVTTVAIDAQIETVFYSLRGRLVVTFSSLNFLLPRSLVSCFSQCVCVFLFVRV